MSALETRELAYFVAVAESSHFGAAADRLGIAQPVLSRAVSRLERRLGVRLVDRTTGPVSLTPAGEVFLVECRGILADVETAVRRARDAGRPERLTLAVRPGSGRGVLAEVLAAYRRSPVAVPVELAFAYDQKAALRAGRADLALLCGTTGPAADLESLEVGRQAPVALLPAGHPLAARPAVTTADLRGLDAFAPYAPLEPLEVIADQVALGRLVVIVGASVAERLGPAVTAVPVLDHPDTRMCLAWLPDGEPPALRGFLDAVRTSLRLRSSAGVGSAGPCDAGGLAVPTGSG